MPVVFTTGAVSFSACSIAAVTSSAKCEAHKPPSCCLKCWQRARSHGWRCPVNPQGTNIVCTRGWASLMFWRVDSAMCTGAQSASSTQYDWFPPTSPSARRCPQLSNGSVRNRARLNQLAQSSLPSTGELSHLQSPDTMSCRPTWCFSPLLDQPEEPGRRMASAVSSKFHTFSGFTECCAMVHSNLQ